MTWPADVDQPLSSAFPGLAKWVCKCRAMVAEKEAAIRGPTIMGFYLLMSSLPAALTNADPLIQEHLSRTPTIHLALEFALIGSFLS